MRASILFISVLAALAFGVILGAILTLATSSKKIAFEYLAHYPPGTAYAAAPPPSQNGSLVGRSAGVGPWEPTYMMQYVPLVRGFKTE